MRCHTSTESACTDLLLCLIHLHNNIGTRTPWTHTCGHTHTRDHAELTYEPECLENSHKVQEATNEGILVQSHQEHHNRDQRQAQCCHPRLYQNRTDAQKHTRPLQRQHPIHNPTCCTSANTAPLARYLLTLPSTPSQATTREQGGHRKETLYLSLRDISHRGNLTGKLNL